MRNSGQNRPRGDAQGPRPNNHRKRRGRNRHRHPQGERQGPPPQGKRNRRRKPQEGFRNRENRPPRRRKRQHPMREHFAHRNRIRQGFDRGSPFRQRRRDGFIPAAGFTGYDDRIEIIVELPGVEEKDMSVSVAGKMLLVKGKKHRKQTEEKHNFGRSELKYGKFHRAFPIPPIAKTDGIKAEFKEGILTIAMPKKEEAKPKEIPINAVA